MPRAFESVLRTIEEYSGGQRVARPLRSDLRRWTSLGGGSGSGSSSERSKSRGREPSSTSSGHRATGSLGLIGLGSPGLAGADTPPAYSPLSLVDTSMDTSDVVTPMAEKQDQLQLGGPWAAAGAAMAPVVHEGAKTGEPVELTGASPLSRLLPLLFRALSLTLRSLACSRPRPFDVPHPPDARPVRVAPPLHALDLVRPLPHRRHEAHPPPGLERALRHARTPRHAPRRHALPAPEARLPRQARGRGGGRGGRRGQPVERERGRERRRDARRRRQQEEEAPRAGASPPFLSSSRGRRRRP